MASADSMYVTKRNGEKEEVSFDKVLNRIRLLSSNLHVNVFEIAQKVCSRIYDGVKTSELDELAAQMCSSMILDHPDYGTMASRIIVSNHHKNTSPSFSETIQTLYSNTEGSDKKSNPLISDELYEVVMKNKEKLNSYVDYNRDFGFDYFGFKTLEKAYLMRAKGKVIERPQHMFLRVALGIHGQDVKDALQMYDHMSQKYYMHATPTLFNSGTRVPQLSSCYLEAMESDSIDGIYNTLKDCARISKYAGGIGVHIHNVRARNSVIRGTNGICSGIVPMLRVFNNTARYVNQAGRRNGSIAVYLEPWHGDVEGFLEMRKTHGNPEERALDLFYALWIPDLFMERVQNNDVWSLMCPDQCPGLSDVYGDEFKELYLKYESEGRYLKQIKAQDLWFQVLQSQIETGTPYMLYKDSINKKSNQKNIGVIKSSNLCVAPETKILTDKGHLVISELEGQQANVWNGKEFSEVTITKTGTHQKLITVSFSTGVNLRCTPYHKFYLKDTHGEEKQVEAQQLKNGDCLIDYNPQLIENDDGEHMKDAYLHGMTWFRVPGTHYTVTSRVEWLRGFLDTFAEFKESGILQSRLIVCGRSHTDVFDILLMLQTLGIQSSIHKTYTNGAHHYRLEIFCGMLRPLLSYGLELKHVDVEKYGSSMGYMICVTGVEDNDEYDDTYCFTEHKEHKGIFNGVITGQCSEIVEVSNDQETAVCNLASMCLPSYVVDKYLDYDKLHAMVKMVVKNLNKVIDVNFYPIEKAERSNKRHRPIGIGIQGLADVFAMIKVPFESDAARDINKKIFETMYHGALEASMELAKKYGPYETFAGSPASQGVLQFDMWGVVPDWGKWDWDALRKDIVEHGLRNSLLLAPMPTASTSQICSFNECFEPLTSNVYKRKTLAGEFILVNRYLVEDLAKLGLWNQDIKNKIIINEGSVQNIAEIPHEIKELYKVVWEMKMRSIIDMAADRGAFVDQTQSMNLFVESPDFKKLSSMHFYAWQKGLKTGMYYLRSKSKAKTQQFTIDPTLTKYANIKPETEVTCEACSA
jgi:ribonucleotide reductase alpha subunit